MTSCVLPWQLFDSYNWVEKRWYLIPAVIAWLDERDIQYGIDHQLHALNFENPEDHALFRLSWPST